MKVDHMLPEVYYRESRDFSYIGRLLEVLLNYIKLNTDLCGRNIDNANIDSNIIELATDTVGFKTKHTYRNSDLVSVVANFQSLVKSKGTRESILRASKLLTRNYGKTFDLPDVRVQLLDDHIIQILLPYGVEDVILLEDLLNYLLPAGWLYEIYYMDAIESTVAEKIAYNDTDKLKIHSYSDSAVSQVENKKLIKNIPDGVVTFEEPFVDNGEYALWPINSILKADSRKTTQLNVHDTIVADDTVTNTLYKDTETHRVVDDAEADNITESWPIGEIQKTLEEK